MKHVKLFEQFMGSDEIMRLTTDEFFTKLEMFRQNNDRDSAMDLIKNYDPLKMNDMNFMNKMAQYEDFLDPNGDLEKEQKGLWAAKDKKNQEMVEITLEVSSENPDMKWDFKVRGIGKDKMTAAELAIGTAWGVTSGELDETDKSRVIHFIEAKEFSETNEPDGEWMVGVDYLKTKGKLPADYFEGDHTYSVCKSSIKILPEGEEGGYIDMISVNDLI
jgi:hypothetical protein